MAMHALIRGANLIWCSLHEDGPLNSRRGRQVAIALAALDVVQAALLSRGTLDTKNGRLLRSAVDTVEVAVSVLVYPESGRDAGMAAALLPSCGVAVERGYTSSPVSAVSSLMAPATAAFVCRRLTNRPTGIADAFTYPALSLGTAWVLRAIEQISRWRLEEREQQRRASVRDGNFFLGWRQFLPDGGDKALDEIQKQFVELRKIASGLGIRSRSELLNAQNIKQGIAVKQFLSPDYDEYKRTPTPSLLAVALRQYEMWRNNETNALGDMVYLQDGVPAFDATTSEGGILLDEDQVSKLWNDMDAVAVAGDTAVDVLGQRRRPAGRDVRLRLRFGPTEQEINLPCIRSPWQLELVTGGLLVQAGWVLSVSSPVHAHVPLSVTVPIAGVNVLAAAAAETIARRWPDVNRADLSLLCLPASWLVATVGTRTMRRKTYNPGGTPLYPGSHVLAGNGYLLSSQLARMSRTGKTLFVLGVAGQVAASWYSSRRHPGDGMSFVVDLSWAGLTILGVPMLADAIRKMTDRVNTELQTATAAAAAKAYENGWEASREKICSANSEARMLLCEVMSAGGAPEVGPHDMAPIDTAAVLEKNDYVEDVLAATLTRRPVIGAEHDGHSRFAALGHAGRPATSKGWS